MVSGKHRKSDAKDPEYALVYSTEPPPPQRCSGCRMLVEECKCGPSAAKVALRPAFRLERKGRGGKSVTVIYKLPPQEKLLKDLCGYLKRAVGGGGTFYVQDGEGVVEIQGERTQELRLLVEKFKCS